MTILNEINLHYADNMGSDKVYNTWLEDIGNGSFNVGFNYGRRGSTLTSGHKVKNVDYASAMKAYSKLIAEKKAKGYQDITAGLLNKTQSTSATKATTGKAQAGDQSPLQVQLLTPLEQDEVETYLDDDNYYLQEKIDGERRVVDVNNTGLGMPVLGINRKGKYVAMPQILFEEMRKAFKHVNIMFDGELVGNVYHMFDVIDSPGSSSASPFEERFRTLHMVVTKHQSANIKLVRTAVGFSGKHKLYQTLLNENAEGVVFKHKNSMYTAGRAGKNSEGPFKYKFYETASFIVNKVNQQRSVEMKLLAPNNNYVLVGNVTIPINFEVPPAGAVIEVRYLYAYLGGSVYQPVYLGERNDITPEECTISQLKYKPQPIDLI